MAPTDADLAPLARSYLDRQPWYHVASAGERHAVPSLLEVTVLRDGAPGLARLLVGRGDRRFQLLFGWRDPTTVAGVLRGRESAIIGSAVDDGETVLVYDALADDELALAILTIATEGAQSAQRVRRVSTLVSHDSLVFDERLFMKCYRVLEAGERPEIEAMLRLDAVGFNPMLAPVARWRANEFDLALVREFLPGALEGRLLALTSLRDLLASASEFEESSGSGPFRHDDDAAQATAAAGGDLAAEMHRLGAMTASMHLALVAAFGERKTTPEAIASIVAKAASPEGASIDRAQALAGKIAALEANGIGRAIRLHGNYHLRRVMRTEVGWLVAGFSDDPLFTRQQHPSLEPRSGSPLEDLADMCFSLRQVAGEAVSSRPREEAELAAELAAAWTSRNAGAFLEGYVTTPGARRLLPGDPRTTELLLDAFELVRDRRYEATSADE